MQSFRSFAAEKCGTLRKDRQNVSMRRGKIEGGPGAALHAECGVFCVRAHWLREAIVRQVRRGRTGRYWRLCFRRRRRRMARCCRPFKPSLPLRSGYFPKPGKDARKPAFRGLSAAVGVRIFFRARGSAPDFPAAARRSGKMRCRRFRSGRRWHSRRPLSFLGIRIGASEMGAGWGDFAPDFQGDFLGTGRGLEK